jgi:hypothetical protein
MAVVYTAIVTVKPDAYEGYLDLTRKAKAAVESRAARISGHSPPWSQARQPAVSCPPSSPMISRPTVQ